MTRELLNKIAKANKVNLSEHTHIQAFINQNYTKQALCLSSGCYQVRSGHIKEERHLRRA